MGYAQVSTPIMYSRHHTMPELIASTLTGLVEQEPCGTEGQGGSNYHGPGNQAGAVVYAMC